MSWVSQKAWDNPSTDGATQLHLQGWTAMGSTFPQGSTQKWITFGGAGSVTEGRLRAGLVCRAGCIGWCLRQTGMSVVCHPSCRHLTHPAGSRSAHPRSCPDPGSHQMFWKRVQGNLKVTATEWPASGRSSLKIPLLRGWLPPRSIKLYIPSKCSLSLFALCVPTTVTESSGYPLREQRLSLPFFYLKLCLFWKDFIIFKILEGLFCSQEVVLFPTEGCSSDRDTFLVCCLQSQT